MDQSHEFRGLTDPTRLAPRPGPTNDRLIPQIATRWTHQSRLRSTPLGLASRPPRVCPPPRDFDHHGFSGIQILVSRDIRILLHLNGVNKMRSMSVRSVGRRVPLVQTLTDAGAVTEVTE